MMKCPKCGFAAPQPITKNESHRYCPKCKHVWQKGKEAESLHDTGNLEFSGVMQAKQMLSMIAKDNNIAPELKAAFLAQLTSSYFEQWFEGFKGGLIADIIHSKESTNDGKDSTESQTTNSEHREGAGELQSGAQSREQPGTGNIGSRVKVDRVKEFIGGIPLVRPIRAVMTEETYTKIATKITEVPGVLEAEFDGTTLTLKVSL